jgi:hypothetical protein
MQAVINAAVSSNSDNAIVHIAAGIYHLDHTLTVPAKVRLQIAGDSEATQLWWTGTSPTGTMISLTGPSYATVRDLCLVGGQTTAIGIDNADQVGGRIFIEGSQIAALNVAGLADTRVDAQSNSGITRLYADSSASIIGMGGGLGPAYLTGNSNVLAADSWYEGNRADLLRGDSGNYTYLGGVMSPYSHGVLAGQSPAAPAVDLANFSGQVNIIGATLQLPSASNGISVSGATTPTASLFGISTNQKGFLQNTSTGARVGRVMSKIYSATSGARDLPDAGFTDPAFIANGFAQARSVIWEATSYPHTAGATDVRIFRVYSANTAIGLLIAH